MKKLLFLLPVITLSACSSGTNYGPSISEAEAESIYYNIYLNSQTKTNFSLDIYRKKENNYKSEKIKDSSETRYLLEMNTFGYFHFRYTETSNMSSGGFNDSYSTSTDFYYGIVSGGDEISYLEMTEAGFRVQEAFYGLDGVPDEFYVAQAYAKSYVYLEVGADLESVTLRPESQDINGVYYCPVTSYYSKDSNNLSIVSELKAESGGNQQQGGQNPFGGGRTLPSSGKSKCEVLFDGGRLKKVSSTSTFKDTESYYYEETKTYNINISYPQNLNINVPSSWSRYIY